MTDNRNDDDTLEIGDEVETGEDLIGAPDDAAFDIEDDIEIAGDDPDENSGEDAYAAPQKSSAFGKLLFNLIIVGVIAAGGWYGYRTFIATDVGRQMADQAQQTVQTALQQQQAETPPPAPADEEADTETAPWGDASMPDIGAPDLPPGMVDTDVAETGMAVDAMKSTDTEDLVGDADLEAALEDFPLSVPEEDSMIPPVQDVTAQEDVAPPGAEDLAAPDMSALPDYEIGTAPAQPAPDMAQMPVTPVQTDAVTPPAAETEISVTATAEVPASATQEILKRLDTISGRLDGFSDRFAEIEATVSGLEAVTTDQLTPEDLAGLEKSIQALQSKVTKLEQRPAAPASAASVTAASPAAPPKQARPAPSKTSAKKWILRSAMPGTAWVSEPESADMRKITVGDILDGLGRVEAITREAGGWIVKAENGSVRP